MLLPLRMLELWLWPGGEGWNKHGICKPGWDLQEWVFCFLFMEDALHAYRVMEVGGGEELGY